MTEKLRLSDVEKLAQLRLLETVLLKDGGEWEYLGINVKPLLNEVQREMKPIIEKIMRI